MCQEIHSSLFFLEEESVKESDGFLLLVQFCQISFWTAQIHTDRLSWYPWKAKAAEKDLYLFRFLQSWKRHIIMYWCCCTWSRYSCCGTFFTLTNFLYTHWPANMSTLLWTFSSSIIPFLVLNMKEFNFFVCFFLSRIGLYSMIPLMNQRCWPVLEQCTMFVV